VLFMRSKKYPRFPFSSASQFLFFSISNLFSEFSVALPYEGTCASTVARSS
jgi:hypothetical protein